MAKNRQFNTHFWQDSYIIDRDPIEKLLFIYCLTGPMTNICGIYECPTRQIAFDTGINGEMVEKIMQRFALDNKIYHINGWIAIKNFIKHQQLKPTVAKGILRELKTVPEYVKEKVSVDYAMLETLAGQVHESQQVGTQYHAPTEPLPMETNNTDQPPSEGVSYPHVSPNGPDTILNLTKLNLTKDSQSENLEKVEAHSLTTKNQTILGAYVFTFSGDLMEHWVEKYPKLDIDNEITKAYNYAKIKKYVPDSFENYMIKWLEKARENHRPEPDIPKSEHERIFGNVGAIGIGSRYAIPSK